jgi:drug/metabolite transporter (DMT)-like permease
VSALSANRRGIFAICGSMAAYTINDAMVKEIARNYPIGEVIFIRGVMTTILIGAVALAFGHARDFRKVRSRPILLRSVCDGISTGFFVFALVHMKLADLAAVLQVSPLILAALSVLLYREAVGWQRWTAIVVGFMGTMFIIKPTPGSFDVWALVALATAISSALRETQTRQIDRSVPTLVIAFMGSVAIVMVGIGCAPFEQWQMIPFRDVAMLGTAAAFVGIATYLMALAFRGVDLSVVAPFRYSYLLTSAIAGYLVFSELPDAWSLVGAVLIVASGLYALHRESVQRRELTAKVTPAA